MRSFSACAIQLHHAVRRDAQSLGLKALRTWAYSDGPGQWNAIQPQLGQLNDSILSQVLLLCSFYIVN